jgi:hypothetical protein
MLKNEIPSVFLPLPLVCKKAILSLPHVCKKTMHLYVVFRFSIKGYNFSTNDMKLFNPPMIFILDHEEV